jgi:hypothetical protein
MKREYKCRKHKSNDGFFDLDGNWCCLYCYKENRYSNPEGIVLKEVKVRNKLVRIVDKSRKKSKKVVLEVFLDNENKELIYHYSTRDLSVCLREYERIIRDIETNRRIGREDRRELRAEEEYYTASEPEETSEPEENRYLFIHSTDITSSTFSESTDY